MRRTKVNVSGFLGYNKPHVSEIHMPLAGGGCVQVKSLGWSPWGAIKKAVSMASDIANNPAVQSFMPPQVTLAIMAANVISKMSKGQLQKLKDHPKATDAQKALAAKLLESPEMQSQPDGSDAPPSTGAFRRRPRVRKGKVYRLNKDGSTNDGSSPPPPDDGGGQDASADDGSAPAPRRRKGRKRQGDDGGGGGGGGGGDFDDDDFDDRDRGGDFDDDEDEFDLLMSNERMATEAWGPDSNEEQAKAAWGKHAFAPGSFEG